MTQKKDIDKAAVNEFNQTVPGVSLWKDAWRRLVKNKMAVAGLITVCLYTLVSLSAGIGILPIHSYRYQVLEHRNLSPSLQPAGGRIIERETASRLGMARVEGRQTLNAEEQTALDAFIAEVESNPDSSRVYVLGTDFLGRDMLARIIYGGQVSILIGILGAIISALIGVVIGALSGYIGGKFDYLIMRFVDIMYSLPYMLLVIILMALFINRGGEAGQANSMANTAVNSMILMFLALAMVSWLTVARVVRGQIISLKQSEFVTAARSMGASTGRIIFRHLVPNTMGVIIVYTTMRVPGFIMMEAFLSFLGLGISAPFASWGSLIQNGVGAMLGGYPYLLIWPALAMTLFLFAMNFLGDGLRDALDPKSKNRL